MGSKSVGDRVARERLDPHAGLDDLAALAVDLVAAFAPEPGEPVVELLVARVVPVVLDADAELEAERPQRLDLVRAAEVHVHAGELALARDLEQRRAQPRQPLAALRAGRGQMCRSPA
jgi:hypothetical protein